MSAQDRVRLDARMAQARRQAEARGTPRRALTRERQPIPAVLRAMAAAAHAPARLSTFGKVGNVVVMVLMVMLFVVGDVTRFDSVPLWQSVAVALVLGSLVAAQMPRLFDRWTTVESLDYGSRAAPAALEGVVDDPEDALMQALAAQPWLIYDRSGRLENLALPLRVLSRALSRSSHTVECLDEIDAEIEAGTVVWSEVQSVGSLADAAAGGAGLDLEALAERSAFLRRELRRVDADLSFMGTLLRDGRERRAERTRRVKVLLAPDLGPLLAEVDELEGTTEDLMQRVRGG